MTHLEKQQAAQAACHPDNITLLANLLTQSQTADSHAQQVH